eukprot:CAMPEP_0173070328 /NCGR_PEP_ID=MMETSP1102-20130122/8550_1 /TAXON_ID=49646 /ORGANISM="Geminigera sp., Strain Caron Lab Isolate" /LENGTH=212 /DNA_ID=CAMNT_0013938573 /DNA_START=150 /DNA_END=785 /DNA_ORIENTATION=-
MIKWSSSSPSARDETQKAGKGRCQTASRAIAPFCRTRSDVRSVTDGLPELMGVFRMTAHGNDTAVEGGKSGGDHAIHGWGQSKGFANLLAASGPRPAWRKSQVGQLKEAHGEQIVCAIEDQVVEGKHDRDTRHARAFEREFRRDTRRAMKQPGNFKVLRMRHSKSSDSSLSLSPNKSAVPLLPRLIGDADVNLEYAIEQLHQDHTDKQTIMW